MARLVNVACFAAAVLVAAPAHSDTNPVLDAVTGTLRISVPVAIVGEDHWVYVNGRIVSAPPRNPPIASNSLAAVPLGAGAEWWDAQGLAARADASGALSDFRGGGIYAPVEVRLAGGTYEVQMLVSARNSGTWFPFAVTAPQSVAVTVGGGTDVTIAAVPPAMFAPGSLFVPLRVECPDGAQWALRLQETIQSRGQAYQSDKIVAALRNIVLAFSVSPPSSPHVLVDLPAEAGGPRELDAAQMRRIGDAMRGQYQFNPSHDYGYWNQCQREYPIDSSTVSTLESIASWLNQDIARYFTAVEQLERAQAQ